MAFPFTTVTINYGSSLTATLAIPAGANFDDFVRNIFKANGFWTQQGIANSQPASATFVPASQITGISVQ